MYNYDIESNKYHQIKFNHINIINISIILFQLFGASFLIDILYQILMNKIQMTKWIK